MSYKITPTTRAKKDICKCISAGYAKQLTKILETVERDPYEPTQQFERLSGNMKGTCSRKINRRNRFIYKVLPNSENARDERGNLYDGIVCVIRAWEHNYEPVKGRLA
jgi:Txe/YoeB family toxin of toxin-antitoxin system